MGTLPSEITCYSGKNHLIKCYHWIRTNSAFIDEKLDNQLLERFRSRDVPRSSFQRNTVGALARGEYQPFFKSYGRTRKPCKGHIFKSQAFNHPLLLAKTPNLVKTGLNEGFAKCIDNGTVNDLVRLAVRMIVSLSPREEYRQIMVGFFARI
jgi:hypothetical protein